MAAKWNIQFIRQGLYGTALHPAVQFNHVTWYFFYVLFSTAALVWTACHGWPDYFPLSCASIEKGKINWGLRMWCKLKYVFAFFRLQIELYWLGASSACPLSNEHHLVIIFFPQFPPPLPWIINGLGKASQILCAWQKAAKIVRTYFPHTAQSVHPVISMFIKFHLAKQPLVFEKTLLQPR